MHQTWAIKCEHISLTATTASGYTKLQLPGKNAARRKPMWEHSHCSRHPTHTLAGAAGGQGAVRGAGAAAGAQAGAETGACDRQIGCGGC